MSLMQSVCRQQNRGIVEPELSYYDVVIIHPTWANGDEAFEDSGTATFVSLIDCKVHVC
jgi:hypothetical protein